MEVIFTISIYTTPLVPFASFKNIDFSAINCRNKYKFRMKLPFTQYISYHILVYTKNRKG